MSASSPGCSAPVRSAMPKRCALLVVARQQCDACLVQHACEFENFGHGRMCAGIVFFGPAEVRSLHLLMPQVEHFRMNHQLDVEVSV